jgi:MFS family permease
MTTTETRHQILTSALLRVLAANFGALTSLYLLLAVVPVYVTTLGVGGAGAVGLATGALMLSCMVTEVMTPRLIAKAGYRWVLALGLATLGLPALALPLATDVSVVVAACVLCGLGFGIIVVTAGALVSLLVPPSRRGEGLGLVGVAVSVPGVIGLPVGVWLAGQAGPPVVFVIAGAAALSGLAVVRGIPRLAPETASVGVLAGLRTPSMVRPSLVFFATTCAAGIVSAFLPLAVPGAAIALLVQTVTTTLARLLAGRYGDRHGARRMMLPGLVATALGVVLIVVDPIVGMIVFGAGFGVVQNASLTVMLERVAPSEYGTVSAVWNIAYDSGWGLGAAGFGVLAGATGYPLGFVITAALMLVSLRAVDVK